jgi:hypothetical protein
MTKGKIEFLNGYGKWEECIPINETDRSLKHHIRHSVKHRIDGVEIK